jgi:hypothetical protein
MALFGWSLILKERAGFGVLHFLNADVICFFVGECRQASDFLSCDVVKWKP